MATVLFLLLYASRKPQRCYDEFFGAGAELSICKRVAFPFAKGLPRRSVETPPLNSTGCKSSARNIKSPHSRFNTKT